MGDANKGYVSPIDQFLQGFDRRHPSLSLSQKGEKTKHERVYELRDMAKPGAKLNSLFGNLDF